MRIWATERASHHLAFGLATLVAAALFVNCFFAWRAEWRLRSRLATIRAAGDPASIADLAPTSIPDDENAAAIFERIGPRLDVFGKAYGHYYDTPIGKKYEQAKDQGEPATKEQVDAIRGVLDNYADVEQAIAEAAKCDNYASRMDFSLNHTAFIKQTLDKVQNARTAARFLGWRIEVLLADGQYEAAINNGIQALKLARLHENEPTLVAYLVSVAMRAIASEQLYDALTAGRVSPGLHTALDQELARHDDPQRLAEVLKTERAVSADWINEQLSGTYAPLLHVVGWKLKSYQVGVLDAMEESTQLTAQPWYQVRQEFGPADAPTQPSGHGVLADSLKPALRAAFEANARSLMVSRALRIDNALRAFAEKNGREATRLDELTLP